MADKKRKGLMEVLAEYRSEQEAKRKGVSKKGASALGAAAAGKKRKPPTAPPPVAKKTTSNPKPNRTTPRTNKPQAPASVRKGNGDGTYGKSMPSNPKVGITMAPRKKRPGTGRTGEAAAKAANRTSAPKKKPMTAAERRAMRLRARRGR